VPLLLPILFSLACGGSSPCAPDSIDAGTGQATIDGQGWAGSGALWSWAGDAAQITTADVDGWRLTIVASADAGGTPVSDALATDGTVDVPLGNGSFVAAYPSGSSGSYAARDEGDGNLTLTRVGDALGVCFDATAFAADDTSVELSDGLIAAECTGDCG